MQGFNMGRYHPPEGSPLAASMSKSKSKAHSTQQQTVRFEMPFPIWCGHCPLPTLIGQGVRFNATKHRAGAYHSTTIWSFSMRHGPCGGELVIKTDPARTDYIVVSGGRRRDRGSNEGDSLVGDAGENANAVLTERERAEQREAAFSKLERTIADRERLFDATVRIGELQDASERQWEDPYAQNARLRRAFRVGRQEREEAARGAEELKDRMGLGIELLPATEEDARRARLVEFGGVDAERDEPADRALARPLFDMPDKKDGVRPLVDKTPQKQPLQKKLKSEMAAEKARGSLASEVVSNTRAGRDPFLDFASKVTTQRGPLRLPGLKRKRSLPDPADPPGELNGEAAASAISKALVSYDSDSD